MAVKRCPASIDVVEAAKIRLRNVFRNGLPVYMSFSGGEVPGTAGDAADTGG